MSAIPPATPAEPLLLEVEGMKCGGCVRAVEQRLLQTKGVRQASVNLLTRTAWVDLETRSDGPDGVAVDPLPALLVSLEGLGFQARLRSQELEPASQRQRRQADQWWRHWRQLLVALLLLFVSGLGHLAEAGQLAWRGPWQLLGSPWFHALVATLALAVPGRPILVRGGTFGAGRGARHGQPGGAGRGQRLPLQPGGLALAGQRLALLLQRAGDAAGLRPHRSLP